MRVSNIGFAEIEIDKNKKNGTDSTITRLNTVII